MVISVFLFPATQLRARGPPIHLASLGSLGASPTNYGYLRPHVTRKGVGLRPEYTTLLLPVVSLRSVESWLGAEMGPRFDVAGLDMFSKGVLVPYFAARMLGGFHDRQREGGRSKHIHRLGVNRPFPETNHAWQVQSLVVIRVGKMYSTN